MSLSDAAAKAVENTGFSLFGMNTGDSINLIIAVVAVLGFVASIVISVLTLRKTNTISLFEQRYETFLYLAEAFANDITEITDIDKLRYNAFKYITLFSINKKLEKLLTAVIEYHYKNKPLPDYTSRYKNVLLKNGFEVDDINKAIFYYFFDCCKKHSKYFKLY